MLDAVVKTAMDDAEVGADVYFDVWETFFRNDWDQRKWTAVERVRVNGREVGDVIVSTILNRLQGDVVSSLMNGPTRCFVVKVKKL